MRKEPLMSVVVPIYGVEKYLQSCINSILNQTYKNIEVVLVDDASLDKCGKICDKYVQIDKRIKVLHKEKNAGLVAARKTGIGKATGEYIIYVDGDDTIESEYIEEFVNVIESNEGVDIVWNLFHNVVHDDKTVLTGYNKYDDDSLRQKKNQDKLLKLVYGESGFQNYIEYSACFKCFRREFLAPIQNSIDERISFDEDVALMLRCLANTPKIIFTNNSGYNYVQRHDSIIHQKDKDDINRITLSDTLDYLKKYNMPNLMSHMKAQYCVSLIEHGCLQTIQNNSNIIFPFKNAKKNSNVIIYGAGNAGASIIDSLLDMGICNIVAVADKRLEANKTFKGIRTITMGMITSQEYDYILITTVKQTYIKEIVQELLDLDGGCVDESKIAYLDYKKIFDIAIY